MINPPLEFRFEKIETIDDGWKLNWVVPSTLSYFKGHFPENPILPAVGVIDATLEIIKKIQKSETFLNHIKKAKFLGLITPGLNLEITVKKTEVNQWKCGWKSSEKLMAEIDLVLSSQISN